MIGNDWKSMKPRNQWKMVVPQSEVVPYSGLQVVPYYGSAIICRVPPLPPTSQDSTLEDWRLTGQLAWRVAGVSAKGLRGSECCCYGPYYTVDPIGDPIGESIYNKNKMKIIGKIHGNQWKSMEIHGNPLKSCMEMELIEIHRIL